MPWYWFVLIPLVALANGVLLGMLLTWIFRRIDRMFNREKR